MENTKCFHSDVCTFFVSVHICSTSVTSQANIIPLSCIGGRLKVEFYDDSQSNPVKGMYVLPDSFFIIFFQIRKFSQKYLPTWFFLFSSLVTICFLFAHFASSFAFYFLILLWLTKCNVASIFWHKLLRQILL